MGWFKKSKKDQEAHNAWVDFTIREEVKNKIKESKEEKLKLLEIASNCAIPGEPSSRTIERAVAFEKYLLS